MTKTRQTLKGKKSSYRVFQCMTCGAVDAMQEKEENKQAFKGNKHKIKTGIQRKNIRLATVQDYERLLREWTNEWIRITG